MSGGLFERFDEDRDAPIDLGLELVPRSRALRIGGRLVVITFLLVAAALWLAPWQQSITGRGRVIAYAPLERQQEIKTPIAGRVVAWHAQEGDHVEAGELLAIIEDNDPELAGRLGRSRDASGLRLESARQSILVYEQQILALEAARTAAVSAAESRVSMAGDRLAGADQAHEGAIAAKRAADLNLERQRALEKDGLASTRTRELAELGAQTADADVERARAARRASEGEVKAMRADKARTDAQTSADVERARASLQSSRSDAAKYESDLLDREVAVSRQQTMRIVAPRAGALLRQVAKQGGEYVSAGEAIAVLVPETESRAVELWLDGRDAPLVTAGRKVRLQFEGWPAVQFVGWPSVAVGTFGGTVAFVDAAGDHRGKFRVVVTPDAADDPWPAGRFLRQSTHVNGWVLLDQVSLGFELWRQWNGFPPSTDTPSADAVRTSKGGSGKGDGVKIAAPKDDDK